MSHLHRRRARARHAGDGIGSLIFLTFMACVFAAGVYVGAHVTLATLAGR